MNARGKSFRRNFAAAVYLKQFLFVQGSLHNNEEIKMTKYTRVIRLSRTYEAIFHVIARATQFFKFYRGFIPGRLPHGLSVVNTSYKLRVHSSVDRAWLKPRLESVNGFQEQTLKRCLLSCLDNIGCPSPSLGVDACACIFTLLSNRM